MKKLIAMFALMLAIPAQAQGLYAALGGAGGDNQGGLSVVGGWRTKYVGVEAEYLNENQNAQKVEFSDAGGGSIGITVTNASRHWHGFGANALAFAPLGKLGVQEIEVVGGIGRQRMVSGDLEEWRTSVSFGLQTAHKGLGLRLMGERVSDANRFKMHLMYSF